jgi:hypothetical protein
MDLIFWSGYLEKRYMPQAEKGGLTECCIGGKFSVCGYWSTLFYSEATGWQQVLYFLGSVFHEASIVKIVYYPTALEALKDGSIFPPGLSVSFI